MEWIGKALSHCPELMDIPGDKCQSGDKTLDLKVVKEQCGKLKLIFDAYQKFSHVNAATKREDLSPTEEKDVKAYIDLIDSWFSQRRLSQRRLRDGAEAEEPTQIFKWHR